MQRFAIIAVTAMVMVQRTVNLHNCGSTDGTMFPCVSATEPRIHRRCGPCNRDTNGSIGRLPTATRNWPRQRIRSTPLHAVVDYLPTVPELIIFLGIFGPGALILTVSAACTICRARSAGSTHWTARRDCFTGTTRAEKEIFPWSSQRSWRTRRFSETGRLS